MSKAIEPVGIQLTVGAVEPCYVSIGGVGVNGGDAIDVTCLSNAEWKTKQPQKLKEVPDIPFTAHYAPEAYADYAAEVNKNQLLSLDIPDVGAIAFWGFIQSWEPQETGVGELMSATGAIVVTNLNDTDVETGPVFTPSP